MSDPDVTYRTYWFIWSSLLILTLAMIGVEALRLPRILAVLVIVLAMFLKAGFITGWFMHLRFESRALQLTLVLSTLLTAAFLFFLISVDGLWMAELRP